MKTINAELRKALKKSEVKGWTRYGISKTSGVSQSALQKFIKEGIDDPDNARGISVENLLKLLKFFSSGISPLKVPRKPDKK